jgi:hypothetical protein
MHSHAFTRPCGPNLRGSLARLDRMCAAAQPSHRRRNASLHEAVTQHAKGYTLARQPMLTFFALRSMCVPAGSALLEMSSGFRKRHNPHALLPFSRRLYLSAVAARGIWCKSAAACRSSRAAYALTWASLPMTLHMCWSCQSKYEMMPGG